jgi:hypothetical protein
MDEMLEWGLEWVQQTRHTTMTRLVSIGYTKETAVELAATLSESDSQSVSQRVGTHMQYFDFIFRKQDLVDNELNIQRGLKIWDGTDVFEIGFQGKLMFYYNDPHQNDVVIQTVKKESLSDIVPKDHP